MEQTSSNEVLAQLIHRGVTILNPESVYVGPEVDPIRISRDGVVLHPGTRLRGADTLIGPGCILGEEGPVTLDDCGLGKHVQFKGGYARQSIFLDDVTVGSGAHIREGSLLEEQASVAHGVGLKQTILMPYATVGSLVNFCDVLLAGGTGRYDHSEVGSGFIHFNFTPAGTKTTATLCGDVPRGVFLHEKRIFLGGQAGAVGPLRIGYGAVIGAGSILRDDVAENELVITGQAQEIRRPVKPAGQLPVARITDIIQRTIEYIAQLRTLRLWYSDVRWDYCGRFRLGGLLNLATRDLLDVAVAERAQRLREFAFSLETTDPAVEQFIDRVDDLLDAACDVTMPVDENVVAAIDEPALDRSAAYLETMAGLDNDTIVAGRAWLQNAINVVCQAAADIVPALDWENWPGISITTAS